MERIVPLEMGKKAGKEADINREFDRLDYVPAPPAEFMTLRSGVRVPLNAAERAMLKAARKRAIDLIAQRVIKDPSYLALPKSPEEAQRLGRRKSRKDVLKGIMSKFQGQTLNKIRPAVEARHKGKK
jgi:hypothetical protein